MDAMLDWLWTLLVGGAIVVYIFTWRGFGPLGQPRNPPFPIWPQVWDYVRRKIFSS